jgi:hypothetical protein
MERKIALCDLRTRKYFRLAHSRADHFAPIWGASGAGGDGQAKIILGDYGLVSAAFDV